MTDILTQVPRRRWRDSALVRLAILGILVLTLLIPLVMIRGLVAERSTRQGEAVVEMTGAWGSDQTLAGPALAVPYRVRVLDEKKNVRTMTSYALFLPETLRVDGTLHPERRHRGIFETVVYRADLAVAGTFTRPPLSAIPAEAEDVLWDYAFVAVGVHDLRGVRSAIQLHLGTSDFAFEPGGAEAGLWNSSLRAVVPGLDALPEGKVLPFSFKLGIQGSGRFDVLPVGKETRLTLRSPWPDPSFGGAFLPERSRVGADGFEASWRVMWFGRGYPQQMIESPAEQITTPSEMIEASAFGVQLYLPAHVYHKTERSLKYGALFLLLTFGTFFLVEVFHPVALHPVQYLLVGAALCLFYLLLLSLSEQLGFGTAYAAAAAATVTLIGAYGLAILRSKGRALILTSVLGVLYGYLYVLLQAEDYALLLGSVGLFAILAIVMFLTRRIDWSGKAGSPTSPTPSSPPATAAGFQEA